VAVDSTDVYWTSPANGTVNKCAIGGCNSVPTTLVTAQSTPEFVVVDANAIYYTNYSNGTVVRLAK
jgi:hypothetical protein